MAAPELSSLDETATDMPAADVSPTAEIDLDDLDLDVSGLTETAAPSLDDLDDLDDGDDLDKTGTNEAVSGMAEAGATPDTGDSTSPGSVGDSEEQDALGDDLSATALGEKIEIEDDMTLTGTMRLAPDETGVHPMFTPVEESTETEFDEIFGATGKTEVLSEDLAVETGTSDDAQLGDDEATLLAGYEGEDDSEEPTAVAAEDDATTNGPSCPRPPRTPCSRRCWCAAAGRAGPPSRG